MKRRPFALINWKMSMTIDESLDFLDDFMTRTGPLLDRLDLVLCPAYTALASVDRALEGTPIALGAQNVAATTNPARTGQISATLLAEAGCRWVMLGHWEVRRNLGDDDLTINRKAHLALSEGITPILLVGEAQGDRRPRAESLTKTLRRTLKGLHADQVTQMAIVYEPEGAIGVSRPVTPEHVAAGSGTIRDWIGQQWGDGVAEQVRIVYGGSVAPEHATELLESTDIDGLGATRRGRDPAAFAQIVRQIIAAKGE